MHAIRTLAFATAAIFVLCALTAGAASAAYIQATEYPAEVKAEKEGEAHVFAAEGFSVKCETAGFSAELPEPVETLEVAPTFEKCTASGSAATVAMEGCKYRLDANKADTDVVCPAGKKIVIVALFGNCEIQIPAQNGIEKDEYVNHEESTQTLSVKYKAEKIKYTKTKDGFLCPLSGLGEKSDGTYSGNFLGKAFHGLQVGFFQGAAKPTKVCAEKEPVGGCPAGQTYPESTAIVSTASVGEIVLGVGVGSMTLECKEWTMNGITLAKEGAPELPAAASFGFNTCAITAGGKGECTVTLSAGGGGLLAVGNKKDGRWKFGGTTLKVSACKDQAGLTKCEYAENSTAMDFRGGTAGTATIEVNRSLAFFASNQGDGCPRPALWKVSYVVDPEKGAGNVFVTH